MSRRVRIAFIVLRCVAAALVFYAIGNQPYSFYLLTRRVVFLTCCSGIWLCRRSFWTSFAPAYIAVGLVFNPVLRFHFHRSTWQALDIAAGIVLLLSVASSAAPKNSGDSEK
jgi:hypothetical protein